MADTSLEFLLTLGSKNYESQIENQFDIISQRNDISNERKEIIDRLLKRALSTGVVTDHEIKGVSKPKDGMTAEFIALTAIDIRFAIKIDQNEIIVREALLLKSISNRPELPKGFSKHFPKVYAIKKDKPPYAYIMQAFERDSIADFIFIFLSIKSNDD